LGYQDVAQLLTGFNKGVPDRVAGPAMCSAATSYSSIKASGLQPGQWAVFPGGGGGVGIQGVQLASAMGLRPIVVDTGKDRRKLAMSLGAEYFIDFRETDPVKSVIDITAGGAHGVFVTGKSWSRAMNAKADKISQLYSHIPFAWNTSESGLEGKLCGKSSANAADPRIT
jgi:D-arabinose 1-dehydrogenase-like Zn-dependent alcohol dehydrogenase